MGHRTSADDVSCHSSSRCIAAGTLALALMQLCSCHRPLPRHYLTGKDAEARHYVEQATRIQFPDVAEPVAQAALAAEPRRLRQREKDAVWDLPLSETVFLALSNNDVVRSGGSFLAPGNPLLASPENVPSIYDPAILESGVLYGQRGVAAALSEFDAQWTTRSTPSAS